MTSLLVAGRQRSVEHTWKTWGDVLSVVDDGLEGTGLIVTDTRFDGVDEPTFRDPVMLGRPLAGVDEISVETASPVALIERSLDEAAVAVETLRGASGRIGASFRGHDTDAANRDLIVLTQGLQTLVATLGAVGGVVDVDLEEVPCDGQPFGARVQSLSDLLAELIQAHGGQDWVTVADVLEYDIEPELGPWLAVVDALRPSLVGVGASERVLAPRRGGTAA